MSCNSRHLLQNLAAPVRPEDFELHFTEQELIDIDGALRVAVWVGKSLPPASLGDQLTVDRLQTLIQKIEARP